MALTPQSNEAFLREVDEELRRDRAMAIWRRWGVAIVAAVVVALAALGGWLYWNAHSAGRFGEQGERYNTALEALSANQRPKAAPILTDLAENGSTGYSALATMLEADVALQRDDLRAAAARFGRVAADTAAPAPLRDLATIRQTAAEYDTLRPQAVIDRLRPLAVRGNPYFGSAGEMTAVAHLRMGRRDLAGRMFAEIARDETVPQSLRQRAVQMAGVLGVDAAPAAGDTTTG